MFSIMNRFRIPLQAASCAAAGVLLFAAASAASAEAPIVSASIESIHVEMEGVVTGPGGAEIYLLKTGRLMTVNEAKPMAPREKCAAGERLTLVGTTLVVKDNKGELLDWYRAGLEGQAKRKSVSIIQRDREGAEVLRTYHLHDCFPESYRKYEPADCDDKDDSLVAVELSVGAIEVVTRSAGTVKSAAGKTQHNGDYLPAHNFKIEIDGCVSGGTCPGLDSDEVSSATFDMDAASAFPGGPAGPPDGACKLRLQIGAEDNNDALCGWMLRAQGGPSTSPIVYLTINTTRGNIKGGGKIVSPNTGDAGRLALINVRILSVEFPIFDFSPEPGSPSTGSAIEKIEIAIEKVERA